ncbi:PilZ domain-containing protein [Clostridiaceae bacterium HSG29]|nr:PilZ domain-containing protein [Clostridiaceae bacterium HSG29]
MNLEEILKSSKSIEISVYDNTLGELNFHTLIDIGFQYVNNSFSVIAPIYQGRNYNFHNSDLVTIYFVSMIKNIKKVFSFRAKVLHRIKEDNFIEIVIQKISEVEQIQRRNAFRLPITKNVIVTVDDNEYEVLSKDISASGLRFIINKKLKAGSKLDVKINFEDEIQIITEGNVIESYLQKDSAMKYDTKIEFAGLKNSEKDKLMNYIFSKQIQMLKKTTNSDAADNIYHMIYGDHKEKRNGPDTMLDIIHGIKYGAMALLFLIIVFFIKAMPETSYGIGRFFRHAYRVQWDSAILNLTFTISIIQFAITSIGLYLNSKRVKRKTDKYSISLIINFIISILIIITILFMQIS